MNRLQKTIFIAVIILTSFLRFYSLDQNPPSLFADEVDLGYQAYSLLKTGKDYSGNFLPVSFQSFADFRTPLYIYSTVPAVWIFGLSEWAVRLPAAIFGILSVAGIYFLVRQLGFNIWVGLISSFFLAISPWHLQYSRSGFEVTLMMALLLWGTVCFFVGQRKKHFLIYCAILFALAFYSYSTAKLFVPFLIFGLLIFYKDSVFKLQKKWLIGFATVFILVSFPFIVEVIKGQAVYRFSYTSIFADSTIPQEIDVKRLVDSEQVTIESKIAHNKLLSLTDLFTKNYLNSFSTNFLFLQGDPIGRHSVGKMGEFYPVEVITILVGLYFLFKKDFKSKNLILFWLLIAPISSSLTVGGGNHASRLFLILTPLTVISSLGSYQIFNRKYVFNIKYLFIILALILSSNVYSYFHQYYVHYPKEQERLWHYGFKQAILEAQSLESEYDKLIITPTTEPPLIFLLFWTKYDPSSFQNKPLGKETIPNFGDKITKVDKFYIASLNPKFSSDELQNVIGKKTLVIANRKDIPGDLRREKIERIKVIDIIEFPSGEVAFYLLTHE